MFDLLRPDQLTQLMANCHTAMLLTDAHGRILWANDAQLKACGYALGELVGQRPQDILHGPHTDPATAAKLDAHLRRRENCNLHIVNHTRNGDPYWVNLDVIGLKTPEGRIDRYVAILTDINPLVQAERKSQRQAQASEQALESTHQQLKTVSQLSRIGFWHLDPARGWLAVEDGLVQLVGLPPPHTGLAKRLLRRVTKRDDVPMLMALIRHAVRHHSRFETELAFTTEDGQHLWLRVGGQFEDGMLHGYAQDITTLHLLGDQAHSANHGRHQFLSNISHELRTPLHSLMGHLQSIVPEALPLHSRTAFTLAMEASQWVEQTIQDVMDFALVESDQFDIQPTFFGAHEWLKDVMDAVALRQAPRRHHDTPLSGLRLSPQWSLPHRLFADRHFLRQALVMTLRHAQHMATGGEVTLDVHHTHSSKNHAVITFDITAQGPALSPSEWHDLVDGLLPANHYRHPNGVPLGMAVPLAHRLMTRMGGHLRFHCTPSDHPHVHTHRYQLSLDLLVDQQGWPNAPTPSLAPKSTSDVTPLVPGLVRSPRVLLVEDTPMHQAIAQDMLERLGATVVTADDGQDALDVLDELAEGEGIDLILMDLSMPRLDGIETTLRLKHLPRWAHVPVYALTANALDMDRQRCLGAGMEDMLTKPFGMTQMAQLLQTVVRARG